MKTTIFFNAMIIMLLGIGIIGGGLTWSALAQTDNQTNADNGNGIMDKIGNIVKEKLKEGVNEIIGGSNNK